MVLSTGWEFHLVLTSILMTSTRWPDPIDNLAVRWNLLIKRLCAYIGALSAHRIGKLFQRYTCIFRVTNHLCATYCRIAMIAICILYVYTGIVRCVCIKTIVTRFKRFWRSMLADHLIYTHATR